MYRNELMNEINCLNMNKTYRLSLVPVSLFDRTPDDVEAESKSVLR